MPELPKLVYFKTLNRKDVKMKSFLAVAIALALFASVLSFDLGFEAMQVESKVVECDPLLNYYVAHPEACNKFIQCIFGNAWEQTCNTPYLWNSVAEKCDYPENVNCDI